MTNPRTHITVRLSANGLAKLDELGKTWSDLPINRSQVIRALIFAATHNPNTLGVAKAAYVESFRKT